VASRSKVDGISANGTLTDGFPDDFANFTNNLDHFATSFGDAPIVTK
jgi:hypothetical protein